MDLDSWMLAMVVLPYPSTFSVFPYRAAFPSVPSAFLLPVRFQPSTYLAKLRESGGRYNRQQQLLLYAHSWAVSLAGWYVSDLFGRAVEICLLPFPLPLTLPPPSILYPLPQLRLDRIIPALISNAPEEDIIISLLAGICWYFCPGDSSIRYVHASRKPASSFASHPAILDLFILGFIT